MSGSQDYLTTQEFAKKAGVSAGTVSKWLRSKKITGRKKGRKWIIPAAEISKVTAPATLKISAAPETKTPAVSTPAKPKAGAKSYSIKAFSAMTYLTEYGVEQWLREGRLVPATDASGQLRVDASNLDHPAVKRLVR